MSNVPVGLSYLPYSGATPDSTSLMPVQVVDSNGIVGAWQLAPLSALSPISGSGVFNVTDPRFAHGATTITNAIIQLAADACVAAGGGIVLMPAGVTYLLTDVVRINGANVRVMGQGYGTNLVTAFTGSATNHFVFVANGYDDVAFQNFRISGACGSGLAVQNCNRPTVSGLFVSGATQNNGSGFSAGLYLSAVDGAVIDGNYFSGNGNASGEGHADIIANLGSSQITNSRITNNRCLSSLVNFNIALFDPRNCLVQGNECANAVVSSVTNVRQGYGIMLYGTSGISLSLVRDNVVANNRIRSTGGTGIYNLATATTVIIGNEVRDCCTAQSDASLGVAGIVVSDTNSAGSVVTGNKVLNSTLDGIQVLLCNGVTVVGNNIDGCGQNGIGLRSTLADTVVSSNYVANVAAVAIGSYGNAVQSRVKVIGNVIRTLTTPGVSLGISSCASSDSWTIDNNELSGANGRGQDVNGTNHVAHHNIEDGTPWTEAVSADRGDASVTLGALERITQRFGAALTADRTLTLPSAPLKDARFRVVCENPNGHTLTVKSSGGSTIKALSSASPSWTDVEWSVPDSGWRETANGTL